MKAENKVMTRQEFKERWESNYRGGGITNNDVADCAIAWGINRHPKSCRIQDVVYQVLRFAGTNDAEEFKPTDEGDDEDE